MTVRVRIAVFVTGRLSSPARNRSGSGEHSITGGVSPPRRSKGSQHHPGWHSDRSACPKAKDVRDSSATMLPVPLLEFTRADSIKVCDDPKSRVLTVTAQPIRNQQLTETPTDDPRVGTRNDTTVGFDINFLNETAAGAPQFRLSGNCGAPAAVMWCRCSRSESLRRAQRAGQLDNRIHRFIPG